MQRPLRQLLSPNEFTGAIRKSVLAGAHGQSAQMSLNVFGELLRRVVAACCSDAPVLCASPSGRCCARDVLHHEIRNAVGSLTTIKQPRDIWMIEIGEDLLLISDIYRYDFATRKVTQVTHLENEFTGAFTISPDGQWIVFERSKSLDDNRAIDLWIAKINGSNARLLVRNGFSPSWR